MQNYAALITQLLASFPSLIVNDAHEEAAKAQLTRKAAWVIHQENAAIGLLRKEDGNNVMGLSVDVLMDRTDGSWVDCASSTPDGPGTKRITPVWLHHLPDTNAAWLSRWVQPTAELADAPGPLAQGETPEAAVRAQIRTLYLEMLMREPDQEGWSHWTHEMLVNGISLATVREALKADPAYQPSEDPDVDVPPGQSTDPTFPSVVAVLHALLVECQKQTVVLEELRRDGDNVVKVVAKLAAGGTLTDIIGGLLKKGEAT
jgi:hypothetical protein